MRSIVTDFVSPLQPRPVVWIMRTAPNSQPQKGRDTSAQGSALGKEAPTKTKPCKGAIRPLGERGHKSHFRWHFALIGNPNRFARAPYVVLVMEQGGARSSGRPGSERTMKNSNSNPSKKPRACMFGAPISPAPTRFVRDFDLNPVIQNEPIEEPQKPRLQFGNAGFRSLANKKFAATNPLPQRAQVLFG